jgi:hypothetical protein
MGALEEFAKAWENSVSTPALFEDSVCDVVDCVFCAEVY